MIAVGLTGTLCACPKEETSKVDGGRERPDSGRVDSGKADAGGDDEEDSGSAEDAGKDAGKLDAGVDSGMASDAMVKNDAGDAGKKDGGPTTGTTPSLESATARQSGRFGADLRIDVVGTDTDGDAVAVKLALVTKTGETLKLADLDGDGKTDPGAAQFALTSPLSTTPGDDSYFVVSDLFTATSGLDYAEVTLIDAAGLTSDMLKVSITNQPVLAAQALCDATYVANRCSDGFGCKGTLPTTCQAGEAPKLTRVSYLSDDLGTRILLEGTDADLDATKFTIEFLNASSNPVLLDLDSDDVPESNNIVLDTKAIWDGSKFFLRVDQGDVFAETVAKVRVKVTDRGNQTSAPVVADKMVAPTRTAGQTCDIRTFDRCAANSVCVSANMGKTYSCTAVATARTRACAAALVLEPAKGVLSVRGNVAAPSLWDSPAGCVVSDPTNQAETVVKLVLATPASKVTLSTNNAGTSFDSAVYASAKCEDAPVLAWCSDDSLDHKSGAELVLTNLAAGSYFVVVDSFNVELAGSTFQLDVKVE
jgi:hypothetical protein